MSTDRAEIERLRARKQLAYAECHARFAQMGWQEQRDELAARIPEGKIEALGIRTTNCTPGVIEFGDCVGSIGMSLTFENFYSGSRQIDPPGLVSHELRLNVTVQDGDGGYAQIASIPISNPRQLTEAARILLQVANDTAPHGNWPDKGYEARPVQPTDLP